MKKAVLFDLDGTVLDTIQDLANALNAGLKKYGFEERTTQEVMRFLGNGWKKLVELGLPEGTDEEIRKKVYGEFVVYYGEHPSDYTKPYPGIVDMVADMRKRGYKTAIVSNKGDDVTQVLAGKFFPDMMDLSLGVTPARPKKPEPDMVRYVLDQLGVSAEDVVYVGDSRVDDQTAANIGMDCVLVKWGFEETSVLEKTGRVLAGTPEELFEICNRL